jgi:hypothetical protein
MGQGQTQVRHSSNGFQADSQMLSSAPRKTNMKKSTTSNANDAWLEKFMSGTSADTKVPAFRPIQSPSEQKAAETTRVFREMTSTATDQRLAAAAKLKVARLGKEADARALAAQEKAKPKKGG